MLTTLGRGLSPMAPLGTPAFRRFSLTNTLPPEITFVRNAAATCLNSSGKLTQVGVNEPRFDHDINGNPLGLMIEPAATNKCQNNNTNPTDTTSFTFNGTGTLSVVDDSAELSAAGLDAICTSGKVYKAEATTSSTYIVYIPGNVSNLNQHSMTIYARGENGSGTAARLTLGGAELGIATVGENYQRFIYEDLTPSTTSRKFTIAINGNQTLYFILNQLEENTKVTSLIPVAGAAVTRPTDRATIYNIDSYDWFDITQGYLTARYRLRKFTGEDVYPVMLNGGSSADTIGFRVANTTYRLKGYLRAASITEHASSNQDTHIEGLLNHAGIRWNADSATIISGGNGIESSISALPTGINQLEIGARNGGSGPINGWISHVEIGIRDLTNQQLGQKLQRHNDTTLVGAGQSLIRGYFISQADSNDGGKQELRTLMEDTASQDVFIFMDGSTGSSAACKTSNVTNYWWDNATDSRGPAFDTFYDEITQAGAKPTAILWGQGEEDAHEIGLDTTASDYKEALEAIFADMRQTLGDIPVYIQIIGRRTDFTNTGGMQAVRDIQKEIIAENEWCYVASEVYDLPLYDAVHLSNAGYVTAAERHALIFLNQSGATGPDISSALRSGTTITVTLTHDNGDDFTPASGIEGFKFFDNGVAITINSAVRADSTTITLTLASPPSSSNQILYYGYDDMAGLNTGNVVTDNAEIPMPLRTAKINLS